MRKTKKCRICKNAFEPFQSTQVVCSTSCAIQLAREKEEQKEKRQWRKRKQKMKTDLLTVSSYAVKVQKTFNKFIRLRDQGKDCISCDTILQGKYDAGHCFPVGHYPNLRFDKNNTHGQCVTCNQHKHGNQGEYLLKLPQRIGQEKFDHLLKQRQSIKKYTLEELRELEKHYKHEIRRIEKG